MDCARSRLNSAARSLRVLAITSGAARGEAPERTNLAWPLFSGASLSGAVIRHWAIRVPLPCVSTLDRVLDASFADANLAVAVGLSGSEVVTVRSSDSGQTWTRV